MGQLFSNPSLWTWKDIRIYMHGSWDVGKKTILKKLEVDAKDDEDIYQSSHLATCRNITLVSWDVGGRCSGRVLTNRYVKQGADAMIYVVASVSGPYTDQDPALFSRLVIEKGLKDTIFLVLANKQDLPEARTVDEVAKDLNFHDVTKSHVANIMGCSGETGEGLQEAIDWLAQALEAKGERTPVDEKPGKKSRSIISCVKGGFQALKSIVQKSG